MLALGVAAVATASFLVYRVVSGKGKNVPDNESEQPHEDETTPEVLENNFFLDPAASHEENEKLIVKWMND